MSTKMRVKFPALLTPGSDEAKNHLVILPSSLNLSKDEAGNFVDRDLIEKCKKLVPSMLPLCSDPADPHCGVRWTVGGSERVAPKDAVLALDIEQVKFLMANSPRGFIEVLGEVSEDAGAVDAVVAAENARLRRLLGEAERGSDELGRKLATAESALKAAGDRAGALGDENERLKREVLDAKTAAKHADEAAAKAKTALAKAEDKSEVLKLQRRVQELEQAAQKAAETTAAAAKTPTTPTTPTPAPSGNPSPDQNS